MKTKEKVKEMRFLSIEELKKKEEDLRRELLNLRFQLQINQLKNVRRIREVKRDIARILTIFKEREKNEKVKERTNRKSYK